MNKRREAAPNAEWVLMYRRGLSRGQIADLVGAVPATVGYHLEVARSQHPELETDHKAAARSKTMRVTAQGLERLQQLVMMVQETGRYPSGSADAATERTLAAWLRRRRRDAEAGTLAPAFREGLAVLPGWEGTPRSVADEDRWQSRLSALAAYRATGQDWPRHKATVTSKEHELGVWLHTQRYKLRRGELNAAKAQALDAALPGWQSGRQRGRKPREQT